MAIPSDLDVFQNFCPNIASRSWALRNSGIGGRGLFACKEIQKGSLIFLNYPLTLGPRLDCDVDSFCAYCFEITNTCYSCEKCFVLLCSNNCETSQKHVQECSFINNNWKVKTKSDDTPRVLAKILIYMRCFLFNDEQKTLLQLLQRCETKQVCKEVAKLCTFYEMPDEHRKIIQYIDSILKTNSFRISKHSKEKKVPLRGLYPLSAFMNHGCVPNTRNAFLNDYSMAVYASKDIEIGEEIVCCYTSILWCTPARRLQLYKSKHFWCKCIRCQDPTELGTELSAVKCYQSPCTGVMLPISPFDFKTNWICKVCQRITISEDIRTLQARIGSLVGALDLDKKNCMDNIILKRLETVVPNNNYVLVDLRLKFLLKLGYGDGGNLTGII